MLTGGILIQRSAVMPTRMAVYPEASAALNSAPKMAPSPGPHFGHFALREGSVVGFEPVTELQPNVSVASLDIL